MGGRANIILKKLDYYREGGAEKHLTDIREILAGSQVDDEHMLPRAKSEKSSGRHIHSTTVAKKYIQFKKIPKLSGQKADRPLSVDVRVVVYAGLCAG